jgi:hypothetical protein
MAVLQGSVPILDHIDPQYGFISFISWIPEGTGILEDRPIYIFL